MGPNQAEYAEGKAHGANAFHQHGHEFADWAVGFLQWTNSGLDREGLYLVGFRRAVNAAAVDQAL